MYDPRELRDKSAIVGIGMTEMSKQSGRTELVMACQAIEKALDDAGLRRDDVDGIVKWDYDSSFEWDIARNCAFRRVRFFSQVALGGGAACGTVAHAAMAIALGMAKCVVVWRSFNGRSGRRFSRGSGVQAHGAKKAEAKGGPTFLEADDASQFKAPYGMSTANHMAALRARRYMHVYGATSKQFGAVALACRRHAQTNPGALMYGKPLTLAEYEESRMVSDPLRMLDCTLECDGAGAVILTTAERARDLKQKPVYVMAAAQGLENMGDVLSDYTRDMISMPDCEIVAEQLWHMAGVTPDDVDVAEFYDAYTILVPMQLEAYGFCKPGEGAAFVENGRIELGGALPVNTSGGNLSEGYIHGITHIIEGVRQMRGTSLAQVPGAELALVTAGPVCATSGLILRR